MGCSAGYAKLSLNMTEYGFYGWKKDIVVAANATLYPGELQNISGRVPADIVLVLDASGSMFFNRWGWPDKNDLLLDLNGMFPVSNKWLTVGSIDFGEIPTQFEALMTWSNNWNLYFRMVNGSVKPQLEVHYHNVTDNYIACIPISADSYVRLKNPNTNYNWYSLQVQNNYTKDAYRSWVKFDLSSIPSDSIIDDAILTVYVKSHARAANRIYCAHHSNNDAWTEGGITWNNQPSFNSSYNTNATFIPNYKGVGWISWDVTYDVQRDIAPGDRKSSWVMRDRYEADNSPQVWISMYCKEDTIPGTTGELTGINLLRSENNPGTPPLKRIMSNNETTEWGSGEGKSILLDQGIRDWGQSNMNTHGKSGKWLLQLMSASGQVGPIPYNIKIYARKLDMVRNAATVFLKLLNRNLDRIAIVEYGPGSKVWVGPGQNDYRYYYTSNVISNAVQDVLPYQTPSMPFYVLSNDNDFQSAIDDIDWRTPLNRFDIGGGGGGGTGPPWGVGEAPIGPNDYAVVGYGFLRYPVGGGKSYMYNYWAGGSTPLGSGIETGAKIFNGTYGGGPQAKARDGSQRIMIIISDGKENIRPSGYYEPYNPSKPEYHHYYSIDSDMTGDAYRDSNVTTYTIGYGEDADEYCLRELARLGHGEYYYATNGSQLMQILSQLAYQLNDRLSFSFTLIQENGYAINYLPGSSLEIYVKDSEGYWHRATPSEFYYYGGGNFVVNLSLSGWQYPQAMTVIITDPRGILVQLEYNWKTEGS